MPPFPAPEAGDFGSLISSRGPFRIPMYQRGYAWTNEELRDFVRDIDQLSKAADGESHFFGTILTVVEPVAHRDRGQMRYVVDGQQRLMTFMLASVALAHAFQRLHDKAAAKSEDDVAAGAASARAQLENTMLWYDDQDWQTNRALRLPTLIPSAADQPVYDRIIRSQEPGEGTGSAGRVAKAFAFLKKELGRPILRSKLPLADQLAELNRLRRALTVRSVALLFDSPTIQNAFQLFSVLNDRGRDLTEADLLRTRMLELVGADVALIKRVEAAWEALRQDDKHVGFFLRVYYSSLQGERWPAKRLFHRLLELWNLNKPSLSKSEAEALAQTCEEMKEEWSRFERLVNGEWPYREGNASQWQRDRLGRLVNVLGQTQALALLLSAAATLPEARFAEIVLMIELAYFRFQLCRGHNSTFGDLMFQQAAAIRKDGEAFELSSLGEGLRTLLTEYADDSRFKQQLWQLQYSDKSAQKIRHLLTTISDYRAAARDAGTVPTFDMGFVADLGELQVEHIYPQNPQFSDSELEPMKQQLPNLTYWHPDDNRAAGRIPFSEKRPRYAESRIAMTRELAEFSTWTLATLQERATKLFSLAREVWSAPGGPLEH